MNKVSAKVRRTKGLYIKVNREELNTITKLAKRQGVAVSKFVRAKAMGKKLPVSKKTI